MATSAMNSADIGNNTGIGILSAAAANGPNGYTWDVDLSQHVDYPGTNQHIYELVFQASTGVWKANDLTDAAGAPLALGDLAAHTWDVDLSQHVIYFSTDQHIHELVFQAATGVWHDNDLTDAAGGAQPALGDPAAYTWNVDQSEHVVYRGTDQHIHELVFQAATGVWHDNDLTDAAGGSLALGDPAGYTWNVDQSEHVDYRGT